jgi:hypothetical protein
VTKLAWALGFQSKPLVPEMPSVEGSWLRR